MRNIFLTFIYILFFGIGCKGETVNFKDQNLFWDGFLQQSGITLFTLFDDFPALKSGLSKVNPEAFNFELNRSLESVDGSLADALLSLASLFQNEAGGLRDTLRYLAGELEFLRLADPTLFQGASVSFEKIRRAPGELVPSLIPISNTGFQQLLSTKSESDLRISIDYLIGNLTDSDTLSFVDTIDDLVGKMLTKNSNVRAGLTNTLTGFFRMKDSELSSSLADILGGIGEGFSVRLGVGSGFKKPGTALKELFVNWEEFYTSQGSSFSGAYSTNQHSSQIRFWIRDLLLQIRQLVATPSTLIENPNDPYLGKIATSFRNLGFTNNLNRSNASLLEMLTLDLNGRNRTLNASADSLSLLEHLLFTIGIANEFGYFWSNDPTSPQIESASGGILTLGDSLFSLASKLGSIGVVVRDANGSVGANSLTLNNSDSAIQVGDSVLGVGIPAGTTVGNTNSGSIVLSTNIISNLNQSPVTFRRSTSISNLGVAAVLWNSGISGRVKRDGQTETISLNTPALSRLENDTILTGANDPIYTKTLPWILAGLSSVLYSGQGPYYNPNRTNDSGEILTLDNRVYRSSSGVDITFKKNWNTSRYKITVRNANNNEVRYAGLGGTDFPSTDTGNGSFYTIPEIPIPESERAVGSDEEAFYKNFVWYLYQKRFVLVIPVALEALGDTIQDSIYVVIVANGLKGLVDVKPFCSSVQCSENDSGRWRQANLLLKNNIKVPGNLENFSNLPGDSAFLLEVWGYGISASVSTPFGFVDDTTFQQVYRLLFSKFASPSQFYGPIPPAIAAQFPSIERLGFLTESTVTPNQVNSEWNKRNHLLPIVAAIANASVLTSNSTTNRNSFLLLSNLVQVLNRPYVLDASDPTAQSDGDDTAFPNRTVLIRQFRVRGYSGNFGMRSPSMPNLSLYYPSSSLRSHLSFLIENQRKWNDGILNGIAKGSFMESVSRFLYSFGNPVKSTERNQTIIGLQQLLFELKLPSESTSLSQFSMEGFGLSVEEFLERWINIRGKNINHSSYEALDDAETVFSTLLNGKSPYSYTQNIKEILLVLTNADLTSGDIQAFLRWAGQLFESQSGQKRRTLRILLSEKIPPLLNQLKGQMRPLLAVLESLTRPSWFMDFFYTQVRSDFPIEAVWIDLERFFTSSMIQKQTRDKNDLFYNISEICNLFSQLLRAPKRPMNAEYWFVDQVNRYNELSLFDRFNFLFSKK